MSESPIAEPLPGGEPRFRIADAAFLILVIAVAIGAAVIGGRREPSPQPAAHRVEARN